MSTKFLSVIMLSAALGLSACGEKKVETRIVEVVKPLSKDNPIIKGEKVAPTASEKSNFKELTENPRSVYQITLKEEALKQTFLLSVAEISGPPTPTGRALANKIVFFEKKGGSLFMFESLDGKLSTDSVETRVLLAEFPIVKDQNGYVTFDFKKGIKLVFQKGSYFVSDAGPDTGDKVYRITDSYIKTVELRGKYIFIDQIVRVDVPASGTESLENFSRQLKYTLSTYTKNPNFKSKESNGQKKVGYFEVHPVIEAGTGKSTVNVMKFDINKPITYHVSSNVPAEYVDAVNEGILYWNRVFGKEVLKVATLPKDVSVHEPNFNIVQWLHWDTAGFAYANMMGDPLTGETLQSHVYMTSVFGKGGLKRAKSYLRRYKAMSKAKADEQKSHGLMIAGFESAHVCGFDYDKSMSDLTSIIKATEEAAEKDGETTEAQKDEIFLRFAKDYVTEVVAHEVGHTLGLRHNFAGSLKTNIAPKLYDTVAKVYFLTGNLIPGMIPGGSVMDYTPSMIASMIGAHIRLGRPALSYDKQAIEFGYTEKKASEIDFDAFCTDTHRGKGIYQDCKVWDQFSNPVDGAAFDMKNAVEFKAFSLANAFIFLDPSHKDEDETEITLLSNLERIKAMKLDPRADAIKVLKDLYVPLLAMTSEKAEFIDIRNDYTTVGSLEEDEYLEKTRTFQATSIEKNGGLSKLFVDPLSSVEIDGKPAVKMAAELSAAFKTQLAKLYKDATEEELKAVDAKMAPYFEVYEKEIALYILKHLNGHTFATKEAGFGKAIAAAADKIIFSKGDEIVGTSSNGAVINEFLYQYAKKGFDLRSEAAKIVGRNFFPFSPSYMRGQGKIVKEMKTKYSNEMDSIIINTTEEELSDEVFDWYVFEKKRMGSLKASNKELLED
ncbi:MAG: hypothetical protein ACJAT2_001470 [Bacteriovoracaceae bacterium]|jgi:hypothetical protein